MKLKHGDIISFNYNKKRYKGKIEWDERELTYLVFGKDVATYLHIIKNNKNSNIKIENHSSK